MTVAEDMHEGCCCSLCGCYFENEKGGLFIHGYPVFCWDCWTKDCNHAKALTKTL